MLPYHRQVLWLRASEIETFEQDLADSMLRLKTELLQFDKAASLEEHRIFHFLDSTSLTNSQEIWLRCVHNSTILVVLDDLDGLGFDDRKRFSSMFSGESVDIIYTARDSTMSERGMVWEADNFDIPPLQEEDAAGLLQDFLGDNHLSRRQQHLDSISRPSCTKGDHDVARQVVTRLGALPAAVVMSAYYIRDHYGPSSKAKSLTQLFDAWEAGYVLNYRRDELKYTHTILESFEVSKDRLYRNT